MGKISELATLIGQARLNPSLVQDHVYTAIDDAKAGTLDIVDPSTPFSVLLSAGTAIHLAGMDEIGSSVRQQYAAHAATYDDLYYHMASVDYLDRFCTPAQTTFMYSVSKAELISRMITIPGTRIKQLILPRHTAWQVNGYTFTMLYPVVIRLMPYGGLEINFDNAQPSPIAALDTNIVDWYTYTQNNLEYLALQLPVYQFRLVSHSVPTLQSANSTQTFLIGDGWQYYYCRVWCKRTGGEWVECETTHCPLVYNASTPTAVLKVTGNALKVSIPQIYYTNGKIGDSIRVDLYTSLGAINIDLSGYAPSNYTMACNDPQAVGDELEYSAPLASMNDQFSLCDRKVEGGVDGLTFEQLQERIIHNANTTEVPITDAQLTTSLERKGFGILKSTEDMNARSYLATRALPAGDSGFNTGMACSMETFQTTIDELIGYDSVADNITRVTIKPSALFVIEDTGVRMVSDQELAGMYAMSADALVALLDANQYVYTPYHYVLDTENDTFETRPYYLDNPHITYRRFIDANETTLLEAAPDSTTLEKTDTGYRLTVTTLSGDSWKLLDDSVVHCQLAFQPTGDTGWAYLNGTLLPNKLNKERVFQFDIVTNWDLDTNDSLIVNNFVQFNNTNRDIPMAINGSWDIAYIVSGYEVHQLEKRKVDVWLGTMLLPDQSYCVSRHRLGAVVGDALTTTTAVGQRTGLWNLARNVAGSERYAVWAEDVPLLWEVDVPERDENGLPNMTVVNGKLEYHYIHRKGDPVLDDFGKPRIRYAKGTVKLDADGKPIKLLDRQTERQFDLFMLDGLYYFATANEDIAYARSIPQSVAEWLSDIIAPLAAKLFENTYLYYYPTRTLGYSRVIVDSGRAVSIPAGLKFHVTYNMSLIGYSNQELRDALEASSSKIISSVLARNTVSTSDIIVKLAAAAGNDVIGIKVDDLGPNADISTYTSLDGSMRCGIRRKLVVQPEGLLRVKEDISYDFVNHTLRTVDQA